MYSHVALHAACDMTYYKEILYESCVVLEMLNALFWGASQSLLEVCSNIHHSDLLLT